MQVRAAAGATPNAPHFNGRKPRRAALTRLAPARRRHLALSTNLIGKITALAGLDSYDPGGRCFVPLRASVRLSRPARRHRLEILSLARNNISRIEGLEPVAGTLQQLWLSYNNISKLDGLPALPQLRVLYLANNLIRDLKEIESLPQTLEARPACACLASCDEPLTRFRYSSLLSYRCRSCRW